MRITRRYVVRILCFFVIMNIAMQKMFMSTRKLDTFSDEWVVLITTCRKRSDPDSTLAHEALYKKQIVRWVEESNLPIFVVESSGIGFPELEKKYTNLHVITTTITEKKTSSISEALSMLEAVKRMEDYDIYQNRRYIMKVTGRYFLEGAKDVIDTELRAGADFYVQRHFNDEILWQNSEYFGMKKDFIPELANNVLMNNMLMEHSLYNVTRHSPITGNVPASNQARFEFFGEGFENSQARGGDKLVINPLR
jgi:hypothetical protein